MNKAIFTICAKNYLAQAITLGASVKKYAPEADFFILLSDDLEGLVVEDYNVIQARDLAIESYYDMAFKYDVIEFSTSIKPFFIDILFRDKKYDKVIYLDPDMVVYNSLQFIWDHLDSYSAMLTPHLIKPYVDYVGATSEEELLFVGIYNLGFFAVNSSETGLMIVDWWKAKLKDQCFADREDALHVDQKWMDFLPALYGQNILILRDAGSNIAFWNMHERIFKDSGNDFQVDGGPLYIFHFSGFDFFDKESIARKQTKFSLQNSPQYKRLFEDYTNDLIKNNIEVLSKLKYSYNSFEDGTGIVKFQRRLFRVLPDKSLYAPFSTGKNSFFALLKENGLLITDDNSKFQNLSKGFDVKKQVGKGVYVLKMLKRLIGIRKYYLFIKFMQSYSRFEKQSFLIKEKYD